MFMYEPVNSFVISSDSTKIEYTVHTNHQNVRTKIRKTTTIHPRSRMLYSLVTYVFK